MSDDLICYVIMRTDLDSLNPGKAMAQTHHAYGALKNAVRANIARQSDYLKWQEATEQDFGTVIVLAGSEGAIQAALDTIHRFKLPVVSGWVHDPAYPIRDGAITHLVPLNTCAFIFGTKAECVYVCNKFPLHD